MTWLTLKQAEALTGKSTASLRALCLRGKLDAKQKQCGNRAYWVVSQESLNQHPASTYDQTINAWLDELAAGLYCKKPHALMTLQSRRDGLSALWRHSGLSPCMANLTIHTFTLAISRIKPDHVAKRCHHATKFIIWTALVSLGRYLVRHRIWSAVVLAELKTLKPQRLYPPKRTVANKRQLDTLMVAGTRPRKYKTSYSCQLTGVIVGILAYSGLRRQELVDLKLSNIDLEQRFIHVTCGKGGKEGYIPIAPILHGLIGNYLNMRASTTSHALLVDINGKPLTKWSIKSRIYRLSKETGIPITPHGLRRTCATLMTNAGAPITFAQRVLRHESVKTTESYIIPDLDTVHRWVHAWDV